MQFKIFKIVFINTFLFFESNTLTMQELTVPCPKNKSKTNYPRFLPMNMMSYLENKYYYYFAEKNIQQMSNISANNQLNILIKLERDANGKLTHKLISNASTLKKPPEQN